MLLFDPSWILISALLAILFDRFFGEFMGRAHPVIGLGNLISWFEKRYYADSILRGAGLVFSLLIFSLLAATIVSLLLFTLPLWLHLLINALLASTLIAHRMLRDQVAGLITHPQPQQAVAMLVSRDTQDLDQSDCFKAGVETYAENLSDGVIAPMFYFLLFGLPGLVVYKAINTMDSMVGYRNARYERFGKVAARLDDVANWLPARITALWMALLSSKVGLFSWWRQAGGHASPNAGYPIAAMAWRIGAQLGGPTRYFGELTDKPYFGDPELPKQLEASHLKRALSLSLPLDLGMILLILIGLLYHVV